MPEALRATPWWGLIFIIIIATAAICFTAWFITKVIRSKLRIGSMEIGRDDKNGERSSPHAVCHHKDDLNYTIKMLLAITIKEQEIRSRGILATQMVKAEEYLLRMKDSGLTWFNNELSTRLKDIGDDTIPIYHADYLHFKLALHEYFVRIKDIIRAACINNGFVNMEAGKYDAYIETMIKRFGDFSARYFSENYIGKVMTQQILWEHGQFFRDFASVVKEMFSTLRDIAISKGKELNRLEEEKKLITEGRLGMTDL